jgi:antitoxin (DNA-binding transcriptional repressor) of toxin-antitoxin stability system
MTTAHASYDVPPHGQLPSEAVDAVADGTVVYLTRGGRLLGRILPAGPDLDELRALAAFWKERENTIATVRDQLQAAMDDPDTPPRLIAGAQRLLVLLDQFLDDAEERADIAAAEAALADPEPTIPHDQVMAQFAHLFTD